MMYTAKYEPGLDLRLPVIEDAGWLPLDKPPPVIGPSPLDDNRQVSNFVVCANDDVPFVWVSWREVDDNGFDFGLGEHFVEEMDRAFEPERWMWLTDYEALIKSREWTGSAVGENPLAGVFGEDFDFGDKDSLQELYDRMTPAGSGPTGMFNMVQELIRVVANLQGIKLNG